MSVAKIQTGLRLPEPVYDKLKVISERESRSLNNLIEFAIMRYIRDYEGEYGPVTVPEE